MQLDEACIEVRWSAIDNDWAACVPTINGAHMAHGHTPVHALQKALRMAGAMAHQKASPKRIEVRWVRVHAEAAHVASVPTIDGTSNASGPTPLIAMSRALRMAGTSAHRRLVERVESEGE